MIRLSVQPTLTGRAHEDPAPAPQPDTFLRGCPFLPSPSSHFAAAGLPERLARRTEKNFPGSGRRERGDPGPVRGWFGAAPAPRRVPRRRAADSRPAGGSRSGASGRRPPGQRELGRERGAGSRRARARGWAGARRPEQGPAETGTTVKGAIPSELWAHRAGTGNQVTIAKKRAGCRDSGRLLAPEESEK